MSTPTMRAPELRVLRDFGFQGELVVDNFAGGGGASTGIERAIGRPADIAINHDPMAIAMHERNHPETRHYVEDIWEVDPREACSGQPVGLAWFSPDCTHFSKARGYRPVEKHIRGLAWTVIRWAKAVRPRIILLENVAEFAQWGPTIEGDDGLHRPDKAQAGATFRQWLGKLEACGYGIEFQTLNAAEHGAATKRERLFLIARRDGRGIRFPDATHGADGSGLSPFKTAGEILNWDHETASIFTRKRPLADPTLARIAKGIERYVLNGDPYIVRHGHYSKRTGAGIVKGAGAGLFRGQGLDAPIGTICATNDKNLVVPWLVQNYGGMVGYSPDRPLGTITSRDSQGVAHALLQRPPGGEDRGEQVAAFLLKYFGTAVGQSLGSPLGTLTTKDRYALVEVHGVEYRIADIRYRMLQPDELYAAQGFGADYSITGIEDRDGRSITKTDQIRLVGNSVCPDIAQALVGEVQAA